MQSLQTYTVVAGKTHGPGNAERLREEMTSSFERSSSFVSLLYMRMLNGTNKPNRSHPANNLGHDRNRSAAAVFAQQPDGFCLHFVVGPDGPIDPDELGTENRRA
jgi:hypothetical protein